MRVRHLFIFIVLAIGGIFAYQELFPSSPKKKIYSDTVIIATGIPVGEIRPYFPYGIGAMFSHLVYTPLLEYDASLDFHPLAAEKFELEDEGRKLRIFLKKHINAEDLIKSFDYFKEYNPLEASEVLRNLIRIEKISSQEVVMHLKCYDRFFLEYLKVLPMVAFSQEDWTTGEFRLKESSLEHFVLERKNKVSGLANYIKVVFIKNFKDALEALNNGNIDFLFYHDSLGLNDLGEENTFNSYYHDVPILYEISEDKTQKLADVIDWNFLKSQLEERDLENIFGDSFMEIMDHPIPKNSEWYLPIKEKLEFGQYGKKGVKELEYEHEITLHIYDFLGIEYKIAKFAKNLIEKNYNLKVNIIDEDLNSNSAEVDLSKKYITGYPRYNLYLKFSGMTLPFTRMYFKYYYRPDETLWNSNRYHNQNVNYYLDQVRYSENFEAARVYLNEASKALAKDPPGLFLSWNRMPIIYRKKCESLSIDKYTFFKTFQYARCEQ